MGVHSDTSCPIPGNISVFAVKPCYKGCTWNQSVLVSTVATLGASLFDAAPTTTTVMIE